MLNLTDAKLRWLLTIHLHWENQKKSKLIEINIILNLTSYSAGFYSIRFIKFCQSVLRIFAQLILHFSKYRVFYSLFFIAIKNIVDDSG